MLCSGVVIRVLLCSDLELFIDEMLMLSVWLGCAKVGSVVVTIMVVMFLSCSCEVCVGGSVMFSCCR